MKADKKVTTNAEPVGVYPDTSRKITKAVAIRVMEFAINNFQSDTQRINKITVNKNGYNGKVNRSRTDRVTNITSTANSVLESKVQFKSYRLSRNMIDRMVGEWVEQNLNSTVYTTNDSNAEIKERLLNIHAGLNHLKDDVQKLRDNKIANPFNGLQPAPMDQNGMLQDMPMLVNEIIMQRLLNHGVINDNLKMKYMVNRLDFVLASETFGKRYIDEFGYPAYRPIDVRNRMMMESDNDFFGDNSPYMGEYRPMFYHEIINECPDLKDEEKDEIKMVETVNSNAKNKWGAYYYKPDKGQKGQYDTWTVQFYAYEPWFIDKVTKNKDTGEEETEEVDLEKYNNKKGFKNKLYAGAKEKKYEIRAKYKEVLWECTRIGPHIYTNFHKCEYMPGSINNPYKTQSDYVTLNFNTIDGERISFSELLEEIDFQYDVVRYMMNRELYKFKGMQLVYDRAYLPKIKQVNDKNPYPEILFKIGNDGIIDINSAAPGMQFDQGKRDKTGVDVKDLGLSKSFRDLIDIGYNLENTARMLAGFNDERAGMAKASATATTSTNNMIASRSVSAPLNYFFDRFIERDLNYYLDRAKISYGIINPEEGSRITGYPVETVKRITDDDFANRISDGRKEADMRRIMEGLTPQAINAGENTVHGVMKAQFKETMAEAILELELDSDKIKSIVSQQNSEKGKQQVDAIAKQVEGQKAIIDQQSENKVTEIIAKGEVDKGVDSHNIALTTLSNRELFDHEDEQMQMELDNQVQ